MAVSLLDESSFDERSPGEFRNMIVRGLR